MNFCLFISRCVGHDEHQGGAPKQQERGGDQQRDQQQQESAADQLADRLAAALRADLPAAGAATAKPAVRGADERAHSPRRHSATRLRREKPRPQQIRIQAPRSVENSFYILSISFSILRFADNFLPLTCGNKHFQGIKFNK